MDATPVGVVEPFRVVCWRCRVCLGLEWMRPRSGSERRGGSFPEVFAALDLRLMDATPAGVVEPFRVVCWRCRVCLGLEWTRPRSGSEIRGGSFPEVFAALDLRLMGATPVGVGEPFRVVCWRCRVCLGLEWMRPRSGSKRRGGSFPEVFAALDLRLMDATPVGVGEPFRVVCWRCRVCLGLEWMRPRSGSEIRGGSFPEVFASLDLRLMGATPVRGRGTVSRCVLEV